MTLSSNLDWLAALEAKATPGKWTVLKDMGLHCPSWTRVAPELQERYKERHSVGSLCWAADDDNDRDVIFNRGKDDEDFIVALRNAAPQLIAVARAAFNHQQMFGAQLTMSELRQALRDLDAALGETERREK